MNGPKLNLPETCCAMGCRQRSLFYPVIKIWARGRDKRTHEPMTATVGLSFCGVHKTYFTISDIPNLAEITRNVAKECGKAEPDPDGAEIEYLPIVDFSL